MFGVCQTIFEAVTADLFNGDIQAEEVMKDNVLNDDEWQAVREVIDQAQGVNLIPCGICRTSSFTLSRSLAMIRIKEKDGYMWCAMRICNQCGNVCMFDMGRIIPRDSRLRHLARVYAAKPSDDPPPSGRLPSEPE